MDGVPLPPELILASRYLTIGDVRRPVPRLSKAIKMLSTIPAERSLDWAARMIAPTFRGRAAARAHEVLVARGQFTRGPADQKALDLVLSRERQLFAPHILLYLGRLAALHGSDRRAGDHEDSKDVARYEHILLEAMLIAAHHAGSRNRTDALGAVKTSATRAGSVRSEGQDAARQHCGSAAASSTADGHLAGGGDANEIAVVTAMDLELAANIMANRKPFMPSTCHRSERRWIEIPSADPNPEAVDLAAEFESATGARFADLRVVGSALWARTAAGGKPHIGRDYLSELGLGADRTAAVLRLISADLSTLQTEAGTAGPSEYESSLFSRFPLVECWDGSYIIMNEAMLVERTLGWLPRYDLDGLTRNGASDGKRRAAAAVNYLRTTTERHAVETVQALIDAESQPGKLYGETDIQRAYGDSRPNADIAIVWVESIAVIEISSRTIMRGTAAATSSEDFVTDLNHGVLNKATQIDSTINDLRCDLAALTDGQPINGNRTFWPILVTTEGWPVTSSMTQRIRRVLGSENILQQDDVEALSIVDLEGLEAAESIIERTGCTMVSLLREHQSSTLSSLGFRDWLLATYAPVRPTARIMTRWDRILSPALAALDAREKGGAADTTGEAKMS